MQVHADSATTTTTTTSSSRGPPPSDQLPGVRVVFCNRKDRSIHTVHPALAALRRELVAEYAEVAEVVATRVAGIVAEGASVMEQAVERLTLKPIGQA